MEDEEIFFKYLNDGIELYNKGEYGNSINSFASAQEIEVNQSTCYWIGKARFKEGEIFRALYNLYLGLCFSKDTFDNLVSREEIHEAIKEIEPELVNKEPNYLNSWNELKKDSRFK